MAMISRLAGSVCSTAHNAPEQKAHERGKFLIYQVFLIFADPIGTMDRPETGCVPYRI